MNASINYNLEGSGNLKGKWHWAKCGVVVKTGGEDRGDGIVSIVTTKRSHIDEGLLGVFKDK